MHETFQPFLSRVEIEPATGNLLDPFHAHRYQLGKVEHLSSPLVQRQEPGIITFSNAFDSVEAIADPAGESDRQSDNYDKYGTSDGTVPASEFNLALMDSHRKDLPDAKVYVPPGFDSSRPVNLVIYNHGRYNTAGGDFKAKDLKEQMDYAPPNSILIVPAWQRTEGSDNNIVDSKFRKNFLEMVAHAVNRTGKAIDDIGSIQIVSHSAGYVPAGIELDAFEGTPLYDRITSVANLDAHYGRQPQVDDWIRYNLDNGRFASGKTSYLNVFNTGGSPMQVSMGQVYDVSKWAGDQRLVGRGYRKGPNAPDPQAGSYPIAFVEVSDGHGAIPNKHFKTALNRARRADGTKAGAN